MPNEVLPCPFCGEEMGKSEGPGGLPPGFFHPCPSPTKLNPPCLLRNSVFSDCDLASWNHRPTTVVTDEVVERVARAMAQESGRDPDGITAAARGQMGSRKIWELYEHLARAALASMPTVVTGEQPLQRVGDHALQASPAAATVREK